MAQSILGKLQSLYETTYDGIINVESAGTFAYGTSVMSFGSLQVDTTILFDLATEGNIIFLNKDVIDKWVAFPAPPGHMRKVDVLIVLLSSVDYSMNPVSFPWNNVTHTFYSALWKLIISRVQSDVMYKKLRSVVKGRSARGYLDTFGINVDSSMTGAINLTTAASNILSRHNRITTNGRSDIVRQLRQISLHLDHFSDDLNLIDNIDQD